MRPIMPYYQHERPQIVRQYSGDSSHRTDDHLLVRHQTMTSQSSTDDDIFAGRHIIRQSGTMGSKLSKSTPVTLEESYSGEHHYHQFGVPQQPSMSYNDDGASRSYDESAIGAHRGGASRSGNSYRSFQEGEFSYSGSYQEGDVPPEEEYYRDQYFSQRDGGQCYTDDGEPYYGEDQEQYEQRQPYREDGYSYDEQRQQPPYNGRGYHQGHPDDYPTHEYDQQGYDGYHHGHPDEYGDYQQGHHQDYQPEYHEANSQDYSGYRQDHTEAYNGYARGGPPENHLVWPQQEEYSHFDDQEESYVSYNNQEKQYSSYEARQNAEGHWEESSEIESGTIASKTLNTNLEGMKYIIPSSREPYDSNYYGGEATAFDYYNDDNEATSEGPCTERSESPDIPFNGASTLASPVHDDERSQGSDGASVWDSAGLRNRSLMDNPVSPLSQTQFTIGNRTEYSGETTTSNRNTTTPHRRRPVSKFIQRTKKSVVGGCTGVTYDNGEFEVRTTNYSSGKGRGDGQSNKTTKRGQSASILDIMLSVGHDLILGTTKDNKRSSRRRRKRDPAAQIVDGFKEMFNCGGEDEVDDYNDYESYRS